MGLFDDEELGIPSRLKRGGFGAITGVMDGVTPDQGTIPEHNFPMPATPKLQDKIESDPTTRSQAIAGTTQDLESQVDRPRRPLSEAMNQQGSVDDLETRVGQPRVPLAQKIQAPGPDPNDPTVPLQAKWDQLNQPQAAPTLKSRMLGGLMGALSPQYGPQMEKKREFNQNQNREESGRLMTEIQNWKRMQSQEDMANQRNDVAERGQTLRSMDQQRGEDARNQRLIETMQETARRQQESEQSRMTLAQQAEAARSSDLDKRLAQQGNKEVGTWMPMEDSQGKPLLYNSKTGETRPSPDGMQKAGTYQKSQQLTPATQSILQSTSPVKDQVQQLLQKLEPYKNDNQRGKLGLSRLNYKFGGASDEGSLAEDISKLEMDRVIAGARVLKGSSRAYQALELAMQHAPNTWIDSPKLMHQKLTAILQNLNDVEEDAKKFGTKGQTLQQANAGGNPTQGGGQQPSGASGIHINPQTGEKVKWDGKQWAKVP